MNSTTITMPHIPYQNGITERKNRTLVECAHNMIQGKNFSIGFWVEAINIIVYLKNRIPTKKLDLQTHFEVFHGYKTEVNHSRVFGCKDFAHFPKHDRRKLDAKSIECIFVGYCNDNKAYKLFHPSSHKLIASRDVVFHENAYKNDKMNDYKIFNDNVRIDKLIPRVKVQ